LTEQFLCQANVTYLMRLRDWSDEVRQLTVTRLTVMWAWSTDETVVSAVSHTTE